MYYYICEFTNGEIKSVNAYKISQADTDLIKSTLERQNPASIYELIQSEWLHEGDAKTVYQRLIGFSISKECKEAHMIGEHIPQFPELQYDGQSCNCGKILYVAEECGCPGLKRMDLHAKENPNYKG